MEPNKESQNPNSKKDGGGFPGADHAESSRSFHAKTHTVKERSFSSHKLPTTSQTKGFKWVHTQKSPSSKLEGTWNPLNDTAQPDSEIETRENEVGFDWRQVSPIGKWPRGQTQAAESPNRTVGLDSTVDKRPSLGGIFKGPNIVDVENTVKKAQANSKNSKGVEGEAAAEAIVTWKRKERDWVEEIEFLVTGSQGDSKKKGVGEERKGVSIMKKGRKVTIGDGSTNGSGLAEAGIQPRRPQ